AKIGEGTRNDARPKPSRDFAGPVRAPRIHDDDFIGDAAERFQGLGQIGFFVIGDENSADRRHAAAHEPIVQSPEPQNSSGGPFYCTNPTFGGGAVAGDSRMGPNCASNRAIFSPNARHSLLACPGLTIVLATSFPWVPLVNT